MRAHKTWQINVLGLLLGGQKGAKLYIFPKIEKKWFGYGIQCLRNMEGAKQCQETYLKLFDFLNKKPRTKRSNKCKNCQYANVFKNAQIPCCVWKTWEKASLVFPAIFPNFDTQSNNLVQKFVATLSTAALENSKKLCPPKV